MMRLIAAIDTKRGVAKNGKQPKTFAKDLAYFSEQTKKYGGNNLVGKNTFVNDFNAQPLKDRQLFVISSSLKPHKDITLFHSLDEAVESFKDTDVWVDGGASIFQQLVESNRADELYLTEIDTDFKCDQFFPEFKDAYRLTSKSDPIKEDGYSYTFSVYTKNRT